MLPPLPVCSCAYVHTPPGFKQPLVITCSVKTTVKFYWAYWIDFYGVKWLNAEASLSDFWNFRGGTVARKIPKEAKLVGKKKNNNKKQPTEQTTGLQKGSCTKISLQNLACCILNKVVLLLFLDIIKDCLHTDAIDSSVSMLSKKFIKRWIVSKVMHQDKIMSPILLFMGIWTGNKGTVLTTVWEDNVN